MFQLLLVADPFGVNKGSVFTAEVTNDNPCIRDRDFTVTAAYKRANRYEMAFLVPADQEVPAFDVNGLGLKAIKDSS